ncbi:MAG: class I SAM-dependent methyltransferase [Candidatus Marinimicrobia bacterium]|nr:class I SAM-dependent methyltransferase [Candidatus Neomarinimicrobiota bacterium]MDD5582383.1 class I SAM-dependent methyltransferase [Candidatus Neomarinimicrobiota bacterium]
MKHSLQRIPPYTRSADFYDELMADIDYKGWAEYLLVLAFKLDINTESIIDFSCGTGTLLYYLSQNWSRVRGMDVSESMIQKAKEKYPNMEWITADMLTVFMPLDFSLGINLHDSLNYILEKDVLKTYIHRMQQTCKPGQSLFFDFALPAVIDRYFIGQDEVKKMKNDDLVYRHHVYKEQEKICITYLEITHGNEKVVEIHEQKIYDFQEIKKMFIVLPSQDLLFLEEFTFSEANENSERLLVVIKND